jgi:4-diphosphocytidyl-2-C-methyl-D-erythritol kinase
MIVTTVTVRVPAKINLQLAVGPLRADGYHHLVTVFHAISLFDEITVEAAMADSVTVAGEGADQVPADGDNLALRAVRALRERIREGNGTSAPPGDNGVAVAIRKRIPVAGGLAGGSADAAAALVACNELWQAGLSVRELCEVAGGVGSDVAFAVLGGTAVGRGRGEQLTSALVAPVTYHWVLAFADGHLSTPAVYGALDRLRRDQEVPEPELSAELMAALRSGAPELLGAALSNHLQVPAVSMFPALRKTLAAGIEFGALGALVSGSGPTCFFLAGSAGQAADLAVALSGAGVSRAVATATGAVAGASLVLTDQHRLADQLGQLEPALLEGLDVGFERADLLHALAEALVVGVVVGSERVPGAVDLVGQPRQAALDGGNLLLRLPQGGAAKAHRGSPLRRGGGPGGGVHRRRAQPQVLLDAAREVAKAAIHDRVLLVGDALEEVPVVRDHDQRARPGVEQVLDHRQHVGVQVVGGLVEDEHVRLVEHDQQQLQATLLPARQVLHRGRQLRRREAEAFEQLGRGQILCL